MLGANDACFAESAAWNPLQRLQSVGVAGQTTGLRRGLTTHFPIMTNSGEDIQ